MAGRARVPESVQDEIAEKAADARAAAKEVFGDEILDGISPKIAYIMAQIGFMEKEGKNTFHKYKYWSDDQISGFFRSWFSRLGITFRVSVESYDIREHETAKEGRSFLTTVLYRFTLTDVATGTSISDTMLGQGDDPGDKGSNKAVTGATKYWLLKTFLIGGEDAEADEAADKRTAPRERRDVKIGESKIEGIERGGRSSKITDVQLTQIRQLAADLGWKAAGTATAIGTWLGDDIELPEEPELQRDALVSYLNKLSNDDAGTVITKMVEMRDEEPEEEDDRDDGSVGY